MRQQVTSFLVSALLLALAVNVKAEDPTLLCTAPRDPTISGLVAYWPMATDFKDYANSHFDLWTPATMQTPTLVSSAASSPFPDGNYVQFDPSDGMDMLWTKTFAPKSDENLGSFTFEFWYRVDESIPSYSTDWILAYQSIDGVNNEFWISTGYGTLDNCDAGTNGNIDGNSQDDCAEDGEWKNMAVVVDINVGKAYLYVNGVERGVNQDYNRILHCHGDPCVATIAFGAELDGAVSQNFDQSQTFAGALTEVRYWNEARSPAKIQEFMSYRISDLQCGSYENGTPCDSSQALTCHESATCEVDHDNIVLCFCPPELEGNGVGVEGCKPPPTLPCDNPGTDNILDLVGYWPLSNNFNDYSGNGYHLWTPSSNTMAREPDLVASTTSGDPFSDGYALFNPEAGKVDVLWVKNFNPRSDKNSGSYTWEFWFRVDPNDQDVDWFMAYLAEGFNNLFWISTGYGGTVGQCDAGKSGMIDGPVQDLLCAEGGTWHHMAFIADMEAEMATMYIDGELKAQEEYTQKLECGVDSPINKCESTLAFGVELDPGSLGAGQNGLQSTQFFTGAMTEARMWNTARSQSQIQSLMDRRITNVACDSYQSGIPCDPNTEASLCFPGSTCQKINDQVQCYCPEELVGDGMGAGGCRKPPAPTCNSPRSGRVSNLGGYWPLVSDFKDESGFGYDMWTPSDSSPATPPQVTSGSAGPFNDGYVLFDPANGKVDVIWVKDFNPLPEVNSGSHTWEFWYRFDEDDPNEPAETDYLVGYISDQSETSISTGTSVFADRCSAGNPQVPGPAEEALCAEGGGWRHMAFVVDNVEESAKLYIDGELQTTSAEYNEVVECGSPCRSTLAFGAELDASSLGGSNRGLSSTQRLKGAMTEVRYWTAALTHVHIETLMNDRLKDLKCAAYEEGTACSAAEAEAVCSEYANCEMVDGVAQCFCRSRWTGDGRGPDGCRTPPTIECAEDAEGLHTTGLIGYWPMSTDGMDQSGSGYHLSTPSSAVPPTFVSATDASNPFADGYALFEPSTTKVSTLMVQDFNPRASENSGSYTWEFWYRVDPEGDDTTDWMVSTFFGDNEFWISTGHSSNHRNDCDAGTLGYANGWAGLCAESGVWHHFAFVVNMPAETATLYVDGVVQGMEQKYNLPFPCADCPAAGTLAFAAELDSYTGGFARSQGLTGALTEVRYWNVARSLEQITTLMNYQVEGLDCRVYDEGIGCSETEAAACHVLAMCERVDGQAKCLCEMGMIGDGMGQDGCRTQGWTVRVVYEDVSPYKLDWMVEPAARELNVEHFKECFSSEAVQFQRGVVPFSNSNHFPYAHHALLVNALYDDEPTDAFVAALDAASCFQDGTISLTGVRKYIWVAETSSSQASVLPTGLTVDSVHFESSCAQSGCWVVKVTYTTGGPEAFNSFYLPHAVGDDSLSYDFPYDQNTLNTFQPANFPCRSLDYIKADGSVPNSLPDQVTTCCLVDAYTAAADNPSDTANGFVADYQPTEAFASWVESLSPHFCAGLVFPDVIDRPNYEEDSSTDPFLKINFPYAATVPHVFLDGKFKDMPDSPGVVSTTTLDPFFYQYKATLKLDEVELRRLGGLLSGTVGVEHTVDTFIGFVNFRPTGLAVLDAFATQTALHLEKTSFFTVSTHGTNKYTFLQYVNLRLVAIYTEDTDFSGMDESSMRTVRTASSGAANYVQVTFTLGSQYSPNANHKLIPLDSVRAGTGEFFETATLHHKCRQWSDGTLPLKSVFTTAMDQECSPGAIMCDNPDSIPDQFVVFNIPLGIDMFAEGSSTLGNSVFVDFVVSALDTDAMTEGTVPNDGEAAHQMKMTLTASIPVVDGGVNIFCDGITAKTDLQDVANVDIVVGSAKDENELLKLTIKKDIASTQLDPETITQIDSDSIEAGLITLVLKGQETYFGPGNSGLAGVSMELEDVITIHIMQSDDGRGENADVADEVNALITSDPDDNSDTSGLITDGYALNGAFLFSIDRASQRAHLEPSAALLEKCLFNPAPPESNVALESCITRRDVRYRGYPARRGGVSTAMEICANLGGPGGNQGVNSNSCEGAACCTSVSTASSEATFLTTILGASDYAKDLAVEFADVIATEYQLNQRYQRAYWINPGYEWTPTQTGGTSIFSLSQKVFLFALVSLDEGIVTTPGNTLDSPGPTFTRRRMLLKATTDCLQDAQAAVGGEVLGFKATPRSMMANAFGVTEKRVATFGVTVQLTAEEACMAASALQVALRDTLEDAVTGKISAYHTLQVSALSVSKGSVTCCRRSVRRLLAFSDATAETTMLVVFKEGTESVINIAALEQTRGIKAVTPLNVSPIVSTVTDGLIESSEPPAASAPSPDEDSGGVNVAIIGTVCGAIGGVLVIAGAYFLLRRKTPPAQEVAYAQAIDMNALKAQLASE